MTDTVTLADLASQMNREIKAHQLLIQGANIYYLAAGKSEEKTILFLHGASFSSQTWLELGSIELLAQQGYRVIAVDLPGYGKSEKITGDRANFLLTFFQELNLTKTVIVSPSMSGNYSLPFVAKYAELLSGLVAVAPVAISRFSQQLRGIKLPTLAIWGSNDRIVSIKQADLLAQIMPNCQKIILKNAGHACYLKATDKFHQYLIEFIEQL